jgi:hypothetical protein
MLVDDGDSVKSGIGRVVAAAIEVMRLVLAKKPCVKFNEDHAYAGCNGDGVASNESWQHK